MRIAIPFLLFLLISCETQQQTIERMNSWMGHSSTELIEQMGPPDRTASNGSTGQIMIWAKNIYIPAYGERQAMNYWKYSMFYLNEQGKVYTWLIKNEQIPPQQLNINLYLR